MTANQGYFGDGLELILRNKSTPDKGGSSQVDRGSVSSNDLCNR